MLHCAVLWCCGLPCCARLSFGWFVDDWCFAVLMCFCFLVCFGLFWCVMVCFGVFWCVAFVCVFVRLCLFIVFGSFVSLYLL